MELLDHVEARNAREEILVATGETHRLVGNHGRNNQNVVVLGGLAVDGDRDVLRKQALGELRDFLAGQGSQRNQLVELVVFVVEEANLGILLRVLGRRQPGVAVEPLGFHRRVRAGRHHVVEDAHTRLKQVA